MCEAMLLPGTITQQPMANSVSSPCKAGSTQLNTVNLRASPYRPPTLLKSSQPRTNRAVNRAIAQAAEVVATPEAYAAQEPKKKIAIFVEPSPFSHVSGRACACPRSAAWFRGYTFGQLRLPITASKALHAHPWLEFHGSFLLHPLERLYACSALLHSLVTRTQNE